VDVNTPRPACTAILSLGSNVGDRLDYLRRACAALDALPFTRVSAVSPVYETEPVDVSAPAAGHLFLNAVALAETELGTTDFSHAVHAIEDNLGRTRNGIPNLPRMIDIDIVAFGDLRSDAPDLTLPHPRAIGRRFVLQPLADLLPDCRLPGETRTVAEILRTLPITPRVVLYRQTASAPDAVFDKNIASGTNPP